MPEKTTITSEADGATRRRAPRRRCDAVSALAILALGTAASGPSSSSCCSPTACSALAFSPPTIPAGRRIPSSSIAASQPYRGCFGTGYPSRSRTTTTALGVAQSTPTREDLLAVEHDLATKVVLPDGPSAEEIHVQHHHDPAEPSNGEAASAARDAVAAVAESTLTTAAAEAPPADDLIVPDGAALVLETSSLTDGTEVKHPFPTPSLPSDLIIQGMNPLPAKLFNALLLTLSFGFAFYTVLNVDHGMTRGWTQPEIAMRIPFDNWSSYENSLSAKPVATKTIINVVIYLLGDWLSQTVFQKKDVLDFDAKRTMRNGFIGLCFGPLVHEYYEMSDIILPVDVGINRIYKIFMDQTLYLFVKCSMYIVAVGVLSGQSFEDARDNAKDRIGGIMVTAWKFWPLVHCVTYGLIPARHRILWVNSVDLIWNAILASKTSGSAEEEEEEGADAAASSELEGEEEKEKGGVVMPLPELVMGAEEAGLNALMAAEGLNGVEHGDAILHSAAVVVVEEEHHTSELHVLVDDADFEDAADGGLARQKVLNGTAPLVD